MRSVDAPRSRSPSRGRRPISRTVANSVPVPATTSLPPTTMMPSSSSPASASSSFHPWSKHHHHHHHHNVTNVPSTMVKVSSERTHTHPLRKVHHHSRSRSGGGPGRMETDSEDEDEEDEEDEEDSGRETRRGDSDGESGSIRSMTRGSGSRGGDVEIEMEQEGEHEMNGGGRGSTTSLPPHSVKATSPKSRSQPHGQQQQHQQQAPPPHWARTSPPAVENTSMDSNLADSDAVSTAPSSGLTAVDSSQSSPASPAHLSLSPSLGKVLGKRRSPSTIGDRVERDNLVKRKLGSGGEAQQQQQQPVTA